MFDFTGQLNNFLFIIRLTLYHVQVYILGDSDICVGEIYIQLCYTGLSCHTTDEGADARFSAENAGEAGTTKF